MFPSSFAPMVLKWVLPEVRELLVPLFKYKDEPNDADKKLVVQGKKLESQGKEIKLLREMVIDLGKDSHPEKPFEDRITALENKIAK
tara:strand:- start:146 stop:406 length:261 start_codon:yes stop_codon:yes gene_type:complete